MIGEIADWTLETIQEMDKKEDDYIEFKSGQLNINKLKEKLSVAASAFSNSNGGCLIIGVSNDGKIEGCELDIGKQSPRDWIDQVIHTEPKCRYDVKVINLNPPLETQYVIAIKFYRSDSAPHMASDKKYYIRNGAHSIPASHHVVEGIRLRAKFQEPNVLWRLVEAVNRKDVIQLVLFTLHGQVAYNVKIDFDKYIVAYDKLKERFPLEVPVINQDYPFFIDMYTWGKVDVYWDINPITLKLEYEDLMGNKYSKEYVLNKRKPMSPIRL